ncbi:MAG: glycoside hydrolase family 99-like domain-containing protein [Candidatus Eremiobacteraeota bacterium]|nr:glycoside hydrolase family 99-like domain-containing protein [Candidatus Eremiobacteraeota bacterium]
MFERLIWHSDRALLGDLVFRLEQVKDERWDLADDCFALYKNRQLIEQFAAFWSTTAFRPRRMLEIGIWDGGSTALWNEILRPERLVAIDLMDREDSAYFRRYVEANGLEDRVRTRWRTDQADRAALHRIVEHDLGGEVDLVIDDGSHLFEPTRASFETLFPLLPPGGIYIIEDWAWEHWPEFNDPSNFWAGEESLFALVSELVAATGTSRTLIRRMAVHEGFVAVERGSDDVASPMSLRDHVRRRSWRAGAAGVRAEGDVKLFAFYLPQYHPIPENDRWWGPGYTEWSRVARARPLFEGHYQPHVPERLGFYDLRHAETRERQAALARDYGITGFCYYYYSFGAKRLLERPLLEMLETGKPDLPFCLCWANENWTRRWDGDERELLIEQRYGVELDLALIDELIPFFRDPRYLRIGGAPVLLVYRAGAIPDPHATVARWRDAVRAAGFPDVHLVAALTFALSDPRPLGFDAAVEFPPHGDVWEQEALAVPDLPPDFGGRVLNYDRVVERKLAQPPAPFRTYRTAMAGWDNTARLGTRATVFHRATPRSYEHWLRGLVTQARLGHPDHRLVFVNAWNEWAEGAHLEPDARFGTGYLDATRRALAPSVPPLE